MQTCQSYGASGHAVGERIATVADPDDNPVALCRQTRTRACARRVHSRRRVTATAPEQEPAMVLRPSRSSQRAGRRRVRPPVETVPL